MMASYDNDDDDDGDDVPSSSYSPPVNVLNICIIVAVTVLALLLGSPVGCRTLY